MNSYRQESSAAVALGQTALGVESQVELDRRALRSCCGNTIAPRMAEIRKPWEPTLFVTVWQCPKCKRVTY